MNNNHPATHPNNSIATPQGVLRYLTKLHVLIETIVNTSHTPQNLDYNHELAIIQTKARILSQSSLFNHLKLESQLEKFIYTLWDKPIQYENNPQGISKFKQDIYKQAHKHPFFPSGKMTATFYTEIE